TSVSSLPRRQISENKRCARTTSRRRRGGCAPTTPRTTRTTPPRWRLRARNFPSPAATFAACAEAGWNRWTPRSRAPRAPSPPGSGPPPSSPTRSSTESSEVIRDTVSAGHGALRARRADLLAHEGDPRPALAAPRAGTVHLRGGLHRRRAPTHRGPDHHRARRRRPRRSHPRLPFLPDPHHRVRRRRYRVALPAVPHQRSGGALHRPGAGGTARPGLHGASRPPAAHIPARPGPVGGGGGPSGRTHAPRVLRLRPASVRPSPRGGRAYRDRAGRAARTPRVPRRVPRSRPGPLVNG